MRVYLTLPHDELEKEEPVADAAADAGKYKAGFCDGKPRPWSGDGGLISWNRVKLFSDGSLGVCVYVFVSTPRGGRTRRVSTRIGVRETRVGACGM